MLSPKSHLNNFDSLRFLFASLVIITHSFTLTGYNNDPLFDVTMGQVSFSSVGLRGFFILSGYLIFQSFNRSPNILDFIWKRFVRIFPGLFIVVLITIFVIGPIYTSLSLREYFLNKATYQYLLDSTNLFFGSGSICLPGVFTNNTFSCEVNGSLWTITYEMLFYVSIAFFFFIKQFRFLVLACLCFILVVLVYLQLKYVVPYIKYEYYLFYSKVGLKAVCNFGIYFFSGALFAYFRYEKFKLHLPIILFLLGFSTVILYLKLFGPLSYVILTPLVLSIGSLNFNLLPFLKRMGDISYGIYLYSFPIQQILLSMFSLNPYELIIYTLLISVLCGYCSWKLIEYPSFKHKNFFKNLNFPSLSKQSLIK
jgi:peptidoglycan/LPS O-acetylase OafA/YrhL